MRRTRRSAAGLAGVLVALVAGCSSNQPPPGPLRVIEFSATGSPGAAYGRYAVVGELDSTNMATFTDLPFSQRMFAPPTADPKMAVALANVPPGSRISCRISVDGRVVAAATADAPGRTASCTAPPGALR